MTWVHLPNLVYSAEQAADCLPQSTYSDGAPSVMSSGTNMQSKSSKPESMTDTLTMPRYGTTLLLSTGIPGLDSWMLSLRASRANLSVLLEKDLQRTTPATAGQQLSASFAKYDPNTRSWRMYPVLSLSHISDEYLGTWPKRVSMLNRIAYRRRKSARTTKGKGSGLWPSPTVSDADRGAIIGKDDQYYQTSTGMPRKINRNGKDGSVGLARLVKFYPTPSASDVSLERRKGELYQTKTGSIRARNPDGSSSNRGLPAMVGGELNPNWVEWLMGWPIGWTALEPLETGRFREWLQKHGRG
jgi:hypothetical protein